MSATRAASPQLEVRVDHATFAAAGTARANPAARPVRCASLLKPLIAWLTPARTDGWAELAAAAVTRSDNAATDELTAARGGVDALRTTLGRATGVTLPAAATWGRFPVTGQAVARMYQALLRSRSPEAVRVRALMRATVTDQRLGADTWADLTGQPVDQLGVKAGWDLTSGGDLLTHVVVLGPVRSVVVLTSTPADGSLIAAWDTALAADGPTGVLPLHLDVAGGVIAGALRDAART